jgi:hypothetical protein
MFAAAQLQPGAIKLILVIVMISGTTIFAPMPEPWTCQLAAEAINGAKVQLAAVEAACRREPRQPLEPECCECLSDLSDLPDLPDLSDCWLCGF